MDGWIRTDRRERTHMQTLYKMIVVDIGFLGHSMISFVNLIRRRSFFVITANHYSVGRLNKQANKIINEVKKPTKNIETKQNHRHTHTPKTCAPTANSECMLCCTHKRRCKLLLLFISKRNIKGNRKSDTEFSLLGRWVLIFILRSFASYRVVQIN